jgi:hypothetical protein
MQADILLLVLVFIVPEIKQLFGHNTVHQCTVCFHIPRKNEMVISFRMYCTVHLRLKSFVMNMNSINIIIEIIICPL